MAKCSVCGCDILPGTGIMFVKNDGKILWYCSKKCDKTMNKLGRKTSKMKWITKKKKIAKK
ncbi:MAG: 50S ribosomal protein L24e [Candidatus Woesearchaeota archaeon]